MARFDARILLLTAALVMSACASSPPASPSSARPAPSGGPVASPRPPGPSASPVSSAVLSPATALVMPPASPGPSATPSSLISCSLPGERFELSLHTPRGVVDAHGDPAAPAPVGPGAKAGELVGGQSYTADFSLDLGGHQVPVSPRAIAASVTVPGQAAPARIDLQGASAGITLPDGHGDAVLTLVLTVENAPCPDAFATIRVGFRLVPAATAAACPTGQPAFIARIRDLDTRLRFGGAVPRMTVQSFVARYVNVAAADQVPPFAGFDPGANAVTAAAGKPIRLEAVSGDLALTGADVQVWRREDVVAADGSIRQTPGERLDTQALRAASGVVTWTPPAGAGEYVVAIAPSWSETCMTGTGYAYLSLRVP